MKNFKRIHSQKQRNFGWSHLTLDVDQPSFELTRFCDDHQFVNGFLDRFLGMQHFVE